MLLANLAATFCHVVNIPQCQGTADGASDDEILVL